MKKFWRDAYYRRSILKTTIPVGVLAGLALAFGVYLERDGRVDFADWHVYLRWILAASAVTAGLIAVWFKLDVYAGGRTKRTLAFPEKKIHWFLVFLLLVVSYSVTFLAVFPGFFAYDATMAHRQVFYGAITSQHPWIHTLILGYICEFAKSHLGHANVGIALYIYTQMLAIAACFTYTLYFIKRRAGHDLVFILSFLFYLFFPTIHMFVLCSTKDTPFSAVMLLILLLLCEMAEDEDHFFQAKGKILLLVFLLLLFLILRKNALYALAVFSPYFVLRLKRNRLRGAVALGAVFLLFGIYNGPLADMAGVTDIGPQEALSVPSQQLARVYNEKREIFTEKETAQLESFYPKEFLEMYLPKLADYTKGTLNKEYFLSHSREYVELWASIGMRAPDIYLNSLLVNTYGFWYPTASLDGYKGYAGMKDTVLEDAEVYYFAYVTEEPGERNSLIPWLDEAYFWLSTKNLHKRLPGLSLLFSPGFLFWVFVGVWAYSVHRKRKEYYPAFVLTGLLWLTVQLGPIALVRYVLYLFFGLPFVLSAVLKREMTADEKS